MATGRLLGMDQAIQDLGPGTTELYGLLVYVSATLAAMAKRESAGSTDEELVTLLDLLQHPFLEAAPHDRLSRQSMASHQGVS